MWRWRSSFFWDADTGGAGGTGSEGNQGGGGQNNGNTQTDTSTGGTRQREADLRAELAAERVAKRGLDEKLVKLEADLATERTSGAKRVEEEVKKAVEPVQQKFTKLQGKL